jgi:hypothetical protein
MFSLGHLFDIIKTECLINEGRLSEKTKNERLLLRHKIDGSNKKCFLLVPKMKLKNTF